MTLSDERVPNNREPRGERTHVTGIDALINLICVPHQEASGCRYELGFPLVDTSFLEFNHL